MHTAPVPAKISLSKKQSWYVILLISVKQIFKLIAILDKNHIKQPEH